MEKPSLRYSREGRLSSFDDSHAAKADVLEIVRLFPLQTHVFAVFDPSGCHSRKRFELMGLDISLRNSVVCWRCRKRVENVGLNWAVCTLTTPVDAIGGK